MLVVTTRMSPILMQAPEPMREHPTPAATSPMRALPMREHPTPAHRTRASPMQGPEHPMRESPVHRR